MESYSRTRWLDKLRPAGTPHRWMGQGARWHLSWPLADTTAQKKKNDYISRFVHVILTPVHAILLCIIQARNSSNYVRHPYAEALLSSARADVEIFLRRHCRRRRKNWQELRPMYRRDSSPGYSTQIPYVSPIPSYITARQQFPESCNSLHETAHTKKNDMSSQGPCCSKKNTICALSVHAQASTQVSFMSSQATLHQGRVNLCTRLREHPQPTSRMPHCVACHPCR